MVKLSIPTAAEARQQLERPKAQVPQNEQKRIKRALEVAINVALNTKHWNSSGTCLLPEHEVLLHTDKGNIKPLCFLNEKLPENIEKSIKHLGYKIKNVPSINAHYTFIYC